MQPVNSQVTNGLITLRIKNYGSVLEIKTDSPIYEEWKDLAEYLNIRPDQRC